MSLVSDLYALQEVDLELTDRRIALEDVEAQLGHSEELAARRAELSVNRERLVALEAEQRDLDLQVQEQRNRVGGAEGKLYGGSVSSPRELVALQEDVGQLRGFLGQFEERLLEVLTAVDELQTAVRAEADELDAADREWEELQKRLLREQGALTSSVATLSERRTAAATRVDPVTMRLYETLAQMKQGRAVARAERGMCLACRINQPLSVVQRARGGQELVQCTNCQRILYPG